MRTELDPFRLAADLLDPPPSRLRQRWLELARPEQITPPGNDWLLWLILPGRGWGKTRTGAEDTAEYLRTHPGHRVALVGPTFTDARDIMVEGESGLLSCLEDGTYDWNRSLGELKMDNGAQAKLYSAEKPDRLRGPQHHRAWCDEVAAWKYPETWDQLMFGLRLGTHPKVVATTTPRPTKLIRGLAARDDAIVVRGSTFDNEANLSPVVLDQLREAYEGTRLGRQELYGEILEDNPNALWTAEAIDSARLTPAKVPLLGRTVVSVDPAVTANATSDETGIVTVSQSQRPHCNGRTCYFVSRDDSLIAKPSVWANKVVAVFHEAEADRVVAEVNNGGDLVEEIIRRVPRGDAVPYKAVRASRGKQIRAEPIAGLYEQGRVHHIGVLPELEDQMITWDPTLGEDSPDRVDALVWGLTELSGRKPVREVAPVVNQTASPWST